MSRIENWASRWSQSEAKAGVAPLDRTFYRQGRQGTLPVLLLHGGGGTPQDLLPLADDLERHGVSTLCPLLPFHALGDEAMGELHFDALVERALAAHHEIQKAGGGHESGVTVIGLSMGAVLGVLLAVEGGVARFVALAPALRPYVLRRVISLIPRWIQATRLARIQYRWQREVWRGIRATELLIPRVTSPLLVMHSTDDESVSVQGARLLHDRAGSTKKKLVLVEGQGHVLTKAPDPETVFAPIRSFLEI
jgi:carboxylesterase